MIAAAEAGSVRPYLAALETMDTQTAHVAVMERGSGAAHIL
jgi:hypothetical protein